MILAFSCKVNLWFMDNKLIEGDDKMMSAENLLWQSVNHLLVQAIHWLSISSEAAIAAISIVGERISFGFAGN